MNPDLDLTSRPLPAIVSGVTIERTLALPSGLISGLSLSLAAIGLYGVTSYEVTRRRTEIGIRMVLGATRARVVREILLRVLVLVGIGVVMGAAASVWASQFVTALLYGLKSRDPLTLVGAVVVLIGVGVLAGWLRPGTLRGWTQWLPFDVNSPSSSDWRADTVVVFSL